MSIRIGDVIAVQGTQVVLRIEDESNKETLYLDGSKYKGISIREFVSIQRGFRDIVCIVEGENLDEARIEGTSEGRFRYVRKVSVRPIGYFEGGKFKEGIKYLPMIRDPAHLMREEKVAEIYGRSADQGFVIGRMLKEDIPVPLPWRNLFNSHLGIFGNTGSGKSNTLAKLYTVLFDKKREAIHQRSKFVLLDFNGEYVGEQLVPAEYKRTVRLATNGPAGDKFLLRESEFWNVDVLSILFQATPNTQRPFLNRVIKGREQFSDNPNSLTNYVKSTFSAVFSAASPKRESLDLMRAVAGKVGTAALSERLSLVQWFGQQGKFMRQGVGQTHYYDSDAITYNLDLLGLVDEVDATQLDAFDQLTLRANLRLANDLVRGFVQFEHIQPLLKRIDSSLGDLRKVIEVGIPPLDDRLLTVISLRRCNGAVKKVLPLLIAKHYYEEHKATVASPPDKTVHLIVDEAHNILSESSTREQESWKDYRLELFEEIIKEGRKFGVFLTVASQRPADISPTIVSQLHNFFIHRLVNDRDIALLENTISTLDRLSRSLIPSLGRGACVVTGTAFDLPMVLQVDLLDRERQPDSEDVNLEELWHD